MRLKILPLLTILILSSCGPHVPFVDDCLIDTTLVRCNGKRGPQKGQVSGYNLTPLQAHKYICQSNPDALNSKLYVLDLETNLAKCIKSVIPQPKVSDCSIDGNKSMLYCSDGTSSMILTWAEAYKYECVSLTDSTLLTVYKDGLLNDIASCTP